MEDLILKIFLTLIFLALAGAMLFIGLFIVPPGLPFHPEWAWYIGSVPTLGVIYLIWGD